MSVPVCLTGWHCNHCAKMTHLLLSPDCSQYLEATRVAERMSKSGHLPETAAFMAYLETDVADAMWIAALADYVRYHRGT